MVFPLPLVLLPAAMPFLKVKIQVQHFSLDLVELLVEPLVC